MKTVDDYLKEIDGANNVIHNLKEMMKNYMNQTNSDYIVLKMAVDYIESYIAELKKREVKDSEV